MDSIIFNNGTILEANSRNELQERKAEAIKNRFTDIRSYGVINEKSPGSDCLCRQCRYW